MQAISRNVHCYADLLSTACLTNQHIEHTAHVNDAVHNAAAASSKLFTAPSNIQAILYQLKNWINRIVND